MTRWPSPRMPGPASYPLLIAPLAQRGFITQLGTPHPGPGQSFLHQVVGQRAVVAPRIGDAVEQRALRLDARTEGAKQEAADHGHVGVTRMMVHLFQKTLAAGME